MDSLEKPRIPYIADGGGHADGSNDVDNGGIVKMKMWLEEKQNGEDRRRRS